MARDLVITEEQAMLRRAARDFVTAKSARGRIRRERFSREVWKEMGALGWLGLLLPEDRGGAGGGWRDMAVVLEELGRGLLPEPVIPALLGAQVIALGGTKTAFAEHLPAAARGEHVFALAYTEAESRFSPAAVDTTATPGGEHVVLHGEKTQVEAGSVCDHFVVSAMAPDGLALYVVPAKAPGVTVTPQHRLDGRDAALVRLDGVRVANDARLGGGIRLLERVLDAATIALAAEMLGAARGALEMTVEYLKTRRQFGVPIGSFQALQHRASRMFVDVELARSPVMFAATLLDEGAPSAEIARVASAAKAKCSETLMHVAYEAIQMHGGIGMTDEHDVGLYLKRARVAEMTFGDAAYHRDRFATLSGF